MEQMTIIAQQGSYEVAGAFWLTLIALAGLEMTGLLSWLVGATDAAAAAVTQRLRPSAHHVDMPAVSTSGLTRFLLHSLGLAPQANDNLGRDGANENGRNRAA